MAETQTNLEDIFKEIEKLKDKATEEIAKYIGLGVSREPTGLRKSLSSKPIETETTEE